jgi:parallel beta-helix repeat protein
MENLLVAVLVLFATEFGFAASDISSTADLPELQSHLSKDPVTCGTILKKKIYILTDDLDCSNATAPITVRDRAVLNLNNHKYIGPIILDGRRAQLRNGIIECILAGTNGGPLDDDRCVRVEGEGQHTVRNVFIMYESMDGFGIGIWVFSDNNFLTGNTVFQAPTAGVFVIGNKNILRQNRAILGEAGFSIDDGDENQLIGNYATMQHLGYGIDEGNNNLLLQNVYAGVPDDVSDTDGGFGIGFGNGNRLSRNVVTNEDFGILIGNLAGPNTIENNIAIRNGVDLFDFHHNCDVTIWQNNLFETSVPECIGGATPSLVSLSGLARNESASQEFTTLLLNLRKWNPKRGH